MIVDQSTLYQSIIRLSIRIGLLVTNLLKCDNQYQLIIAASSSLINFYSPVLPTRLTTRLTSISVILTDCQLYP